MGEIGLVPGFEDKPLIIIGGQKAMIFVNPQQDYVEPLILADSTGAFGQ